MIAYASAHWVAILIGILLMEYWRRRSAQPKGQSPT